jgi:predicted phage tail component-like protein
MFSFNGIHALEMGVIADQLSRELKPQRRVTQTQIPGRDGTYDYSDGTYDNVILTFKCNFIGKDIDRYKDKVAMWLSGSGVLTLDTDTTRHYNANVYASIPLDQMVLWHEFTLTFECEPFMQSDNRQITTNGTTIPVHSDGTQPAPCTIIITNIGETDITNISLTREANIGG